MHKKSLELSFAIQRSFPSRKLSNLKDDVIITVDKNKNITKATDRLK